MGRESGQQQHSAAEPSDTAGLGAGTVEGKQHPTGRVKRTSKLLGSFALILALFSPFLLGVAQGSLWLAGVVAGGIIVVQVLLECDKFFPRQLNLRLCGREQRSSGRRGGACRYGFLFDE